jgi:hypothetical protein
MFGLFGRCNRIFPNRAAHVSHMNEVLTLLRDVGLSLKLKKCHFFAETVHYLGHVIRPGRLGVDEKNTEALKKARLPKTDRRAVLSGFLMSIGVSSLIYQPFWRRSTRSFQKTHLPRWGPCLRRPSRLSTPSENFYFRPHPRPTPRCGKDIPGHECL